jgi:hypothetical protein
VRVRARPPYLPLYCGWIDSYTPLVHATRTRHSYTPLDTPLDTPLHTPLLRLSYASLSDFPPVVGVLQCAPIRAPRHQRELKALPPISSDRSNLSSAFSLGNSLRAYYNTRFLQRLRAVASMAPSFPNRLPAIPTLGYAH